MAADAVIARDLAVAEAAPATLEGALATNGFAVGAEIASWPLSAAPEAAMTGIRAAAAEARKPMEAKRDAVVSEETARLDAVVAALDPAIDTPEALPDCRIYDQPQSWLQPLHRQCRDLRLSFALRHSELRCERLFTDAEAPDALRSAKLDLGGATTTTLRSLLCDNGLDARLDQRGGLLSARRHELTLEIGTPSSPMTLNGRLQVPEEGSDLWRLTGLEVTPGRLARHLDPDGPETLAHCLSVPDACAE